MNDKPFVKHWVAIVILLLGVVLDGTLMQVFGHWLIQGTSVAVPQVTTMFAVMIAIFVPRESWLMFLTIVAGLIFDMFYTGILGVTTFILPLIVYLVIQMRPLVPRSWPFVWAVFIIGLTLRMLGNYLVAIFLNETSASFLKLVTQHLGPGLTVNIILFAILYYPLSRILVKWTED